MNPTTTKETGYIEGFQWALPKAFSDPLNKCRFELGDILYDNRSAYEESWGAASQKLNYSLQIVFPQRTSGTGGKAGDSENVFTANWNSSVRFRLINHAEAKNELVSTTQGRLYTMLWKGCLEEIRSARKSDVPAGMNEASKMLEQIVVKKLCESAFSFIYDTSSNLSAQKFEKLSKSFGPTSRSERLKLTAISALDTIEFLPTLELVTFHIDIPKESCEDYIKDALYIPLKNKITDRERFRPRDHGLIS